MANVQLPSYAGSNFKFDNSPWATRSGSTTEVGTIISNLIPYVYVAAGLILLLILILGGIGLMTSAGSADKTKAAYGKIQAGLIGFLIIFISYFAAKIVEIVLGVKFM